jgi:hypothetical protein
MDTRCRECNRVVELAERTCRACGYPLAAVAPEVIDVRDVDPERDVIDLIGAVLAAQENSPHPPPRFHLRHLDPDPIVDLEARDLVPAFAESRRRGARR